jgi:hypothetical protein
MSFCGKITQRDSPCRLAWPAKKLTCGVQTVFCWAKHRCRNEEDLIVAVAVSNILVSWNMAHTGTFLSFIPYTLVVFP